MKKQIQASLDRHRRAIAGMLQQVDVLHDIAIKIRRVIVDGHRIYLCGNGGSAADAQHIAAEFVGRFKTKRPPIPAIALTTDTSVLTSVANDFDYGQVFSRQVEALVTSNDLLWVLSTSGKSHNILEAMRYADSVNAGVIGFTGPNPPDEFVDLCDLVFKAPGEDTASIQECHQVAYHAIIGAVEQNL